MLIGIAPLFWTRQIRDENIGTFVFYKKFIYYCNGDKYKFSLVRSELVEGFERFFNHMLEWFDPAFA